MPNRRAIKRRRSVELRLVDKSTRAFGVEATVKGARTTVLSLYPIKSRPNKSLETLQWELIKKESDNRREGFFIADNRVLAE